MAKIEIINEDYGAPFTGEKYEVDTSRRFGGYQDGDLICYINPFFGVPLTLYIAVRINGDLIFRSWEWSDRGTNYLQTSETPDKFAATTEQIDTVNGLFSGRIKFDGLKLAVGATVQEICPIDVEREEKITGEKIYRA